MRVGVLELALGVALAAIGVSQQRSLTAIVEITIAITEAFHALGVAAAVAAHTLRVRRLDEEAAAALTTAAMLFVTVQLDLTAAPVAIAVRIA